MKILKRWTTTISSSFDWVIAQVENHEALVNTAIREMTQASRKAQAQLMRVKRDGALMRERLAQLQASIVQWEERAVAVHDKDRERALECLRRKKRAEREIALLKNNISEHARLETQLTQDMQTISLRIEELKRKKNSLAARQYRAQAAQAGQSDDMGLISEIDDIFERWESKITECEAFELKLDTLEQEFIHEEEEKCLQNELNKLVAPAN